MTVQSGSESVSMRVIPMRGRPRDIAPIIGMDSHGGGDGRAGKYQRARAA